MCNSFLALPTITTGISKILLKAAPLSDLLGKGIMWRWGPTQQHAFEQLKVMLTTAPVLAFADPAPLYQIETNA